MKTVPEGHSACHPWLAVLAIVVFALGLRTGLASVAPIAIAIDLPPGLTANVLGWLAATPAFAYALAGLFSARLVASFGLPPVVIVVIFLNVAAHVARALSGDIVWLFVATSVLMLGVGVGNVVLPVLVKTAAPHRIGAVTGWYTAALAISTAVPAAVSPIVADALGWRFAVGMWALISAVGAVVWAFIIMKAPNPFTVIPDDHLASGVDTRPKEFHQSMTAVAVLGAFSVASVTAYTMFGMFPLIASDVWQLDPVTAGFGLSLFAVIGLPLALVTPRFVAKPVQVRTLVMVAGVALVGGYLLMILGSTNLWVLSTALLALGTLCFSLSLALIGQTTRTVSTSSGLSAYVNGWGYFFSGLGPIVAGGLHVWTGTWSLSLLVMAVISASAFPIAWQLGKGQFVDDELRGFDTTA